MDSRIIFNRKGSAFMDYALLLGIVASLFFTFNTYIKRGIQAHVKGMTDNILCSEQAGETSSTAVTTASTSSDYDSALDNEIFLGGSQKMSLVENTKVTSASRTEDSDIPYTQEPFTSAEAGTIITPERGSDSPAGGGGGGGGGGWGKGRLDLLDLSGGAN